MDNLPAELRASLQPVMADLERTVPGLLRVTIGDWSGIPRQVTATLWDTSGSGTGVSILLGESPVTQVASVAEQVQEAAVEALWGEGRPAVWPECPGHPNSHPLKPIVSGDATTWTCPATGERIADVGTLVDE